MGWDAWATKDGLVVKLAYDPVSSTTALVDGELRAIFAEAAQRVHERTGTADGLLSHGGLDVSLCAEALELATNQDAWSEDDWTPEQVKRLAKTANWTFGFAPEQEWARWSAREFLETCAKHDLGIHFSW